MLSLVSYGSCVQLHDNRSDGHRAVGVDPVLVKVIRPDDRDDLSLTAHVSAGSASP
jgi:hypothetical protein